jgi:hypothetical protein
LEHPCAKQNPLDGTPEEWRARSGFFGWLGDLECRENDAGWLVLLFDPGYFRGNENCYHYMCFGVFQPD